MQHGPCSNLFNFVIGHKDIKLILTILLNISMRVWVPNWIEKCVKTFKHVNILIRDKHV